MVGAAVAFSLRALVDFVLLAGFAGILRLSITSLLTPVLLLAAAFLTATQTNPGQPAWFALVVVNLLITIIWAWRQAPAALREFAFARLKPVAAFRAKH